jgi:hypothetical protein
VAVAGGQARVARHLRFRQNQDLASTLFDCSRSPSNSRTRPRPSTW